MPPAHRTDPDPRPTVRWIFGDGSPRRSILAALTKSVPTSPVTVSLAVGPTVRWRDEIHEVLAAFARRCAGDVQHLWRPPEVVRHYLDTGDESARAEAERRCVFPAQGVPGSAARAARRAAGWESFAVPQLDWVALAAWDAAWAQSAGRPRGPEWIAIRRRQTSRLQRMVLHRALPEHLAPLADTEPGCCVALDWILSHADAGSAPWA